MSEHRSVLVPVIRTIKAPLECPLGLIPEVKRGSGNTGGRREASSLLPPDWDQTDNVSVSVISGIGLSVED